MRDNGYNDERGLDRHAQQIRTTPLRVRFSFLKLKLNIRIVSKMISFNRKLAQKCTYSDNPVLDPFLLL